MDKQSLRNTEAIDKEPRLKAILEEYPDHTFTVMDGFDSAIIGVELSEMLLVYSVRLIIKKLMEQMTLVDAWEWYYYNIECVCVGNNRVILQE
jgi:hypothetical protein